MTKATTEQPVVASTTAKRTRSIKAAATQPVAVVSQQNPLELANGDSNFALLNLFERLITTPDLPVDKLVAMYDLMERFRNTNAEIAYSRAMLDLQAELPPIVKTASINGESKDGKKYDGGMYAPFEEIQKVVQPLLTKHGFSVSFSPDPFDVNNLKITCTIMHRDGHTKTSSVLMPFDRSGGKNPAQAVVSSTSYGKRNLLVAMLNIQTVGEDDNGQSGAGYVCITEQQQKYLISLYSNLNSFGQNQYHEAFGDIRQLSTAHYNRAEAMLKNLGGNTRLPQYDQSRGGNNHAPRR